MISILLLILAGSSRGLKADPIWYDEWYSLYYAGATPQYGPLSLAQTVERTLEYQEFNPPGYYLLLNLWGQIAGWTPYATRTLSLLLGVLAIALIYRLGREAVSPLAGLGAALALGSSAYFVNQMHEMRMYPLFMLMMVLSLWSYWRLVGQTHKSMSVQKRASTITGFWLVVFCLSLAGLLYTHYMALPLVVSLALFHLVFAPKNRRWSGVSMAALMAGILFLPWASVAVRALGVVSGETARRVLGYTPLELLNTATTQFSNAATPLLAIFGWYALRGRRPGVWFVWTLVIGTFGVYLIISNQFGVIGSPRYLMALWPPLALLVGLGAEQMGRLNLRPAILLVVWVLMGAGYIISLQTVFEPAEQIWQVYLPWDKLADKLRLQTVHDDRVVFLLPAPTPYWFHAPVAAYYFHDLRTQVEPIPPWINIPPFEQPDTRLHLVESLEAKSPQMFGEEAQAIVKDATSVWIAYSPTYFPSPFVRPEFDQTLAEQGFVACQPNDAQSDLRLDLYSRVNPDQLSLHFTDDIRVGLLSPLPDASDSNLGVRLGWSITDHVPPNTYSAGLHVDNAAGQLVSQSDFALPGSGTACSVARLSLENLPSGTYSLNLVIYDWQSGKRLLSDGSDRISVGHLSLVVKE